MIRAFSQQHLIEDSTDWQKIIEENCKGIDLEALRNLPFSEREVLMAKYQSFFSQKYQNFFEFVNDFSKGEPEASARITCSRSALHWSDRSVDSHRNPFSLQLRVNVDVPIQHLLQLLQNRWKNKHQKVQNSVRLFALLLVGYSCLLIKAFVGMFTMLVLNFRDLGEAAPKTNCVLATIPLELLEGINTQNDQFLGLNKIVSVLENFKGESEAIKTNLMINMMNIRESKVDLSAQDTFTKIQTFASHNKGALLVELTSDKKALDPRGKSIKPIVITNFTDSVTSELKTEMEGYVQVLGLLVTSAKKGVEFGTSECVGNCRRRNRSSALELRNWNQRHYRSKGSLLETFRLVCDLFDDCDLLLLRGVILLHRNWCLRAIYFGGVNYRLFLPNQRQVPLFFLRHKFMCVSPERF